MGDKSLQGLYLSCKAFLSGQEGEVEVVSHLESLQTLLPGRGTPPYLPTREPGK